MSKLLPNFYLIAKKKHCGKTVADILLTGFILFFSKRFMLSLLKKKKKIKNTEDSVHITAFLLEGD